MSACLYDHLCGGCDRPQWPQATRAELLTQGLQRMLQNIRETSRPWATASTEIAYHGFGEWYLRDRVDLTIESHKGVARLGLYAKNSRVREIVDLPGCPQLSPALESWLRDFRRDLPPLEGRGSVRLRVSPRGLRGVWLDFANIDLKAILDDQAWLNRQASQAVIVEMGQRRKRAHRDENRWRLIDPTPEAWFETWLSTDSDSSPQPLFGKIASFTQPSRSANRQLIRLALQQLSAEEHALELGSGIGNFTLPIAARSKGVTAWENDRSALEDLHFNLESCGLGHKVNVEAIDFIRGVGLHQRTRLGGTSQVSDASSPEALPPFGNSKPSFALVDPPRAGLGDFAEVLAKAEGRLDGIEKLSYVSCYPESWARDLQTFATNGWTLREAHLVDQFPRTRHVEIVSHLVRR